MRFSRDAVRGDSGSDGSHERNSGPDLLTDAIRAAAARVRVVVPPDPGHGIDNDWVLRWGEQIDVQPIGAFGDGENLTEQAVASYVATYATKAAETTGTVDHLMFALRARLAGVRVIPLRNTRHTCSSLLVALKVHPKVAQRILRHSQIAMTMEVCAEASEEQVCAAIGKPSDAMGGDG
ncbi:replication initiator [Streptomyces sp. NPDC006482]|uniref:replication initiator n=1 Tax=Streptomyces sp. NPDC006482 TaxID=3154306 RepID=UPI0033B6F7BC